MRNSRQIVRLLMILCTGLAVVGQLGALVPSEGSPVAGKAYRHPGLDVEDDYRYPAQLPPQAAARAHQDLAALGVSADRGLVDARSGRFGTLLLAAPVMPGSGVDNRLSWENLGVTPPADRAALGQAAWGAFTGYLEDREQLLRIDRREIGEPGRVAVHGDGDVVQIYAQRRIDGIPVQGSFLNAVFNHGNLVLFGANKWGDVNISTEPRLSADQARARVADYLEPHRASGYWGAAELLIVPLANAQIEVGEGYTYRLAWVIRPRFADDLGSWEAVVDTESGELLSFGDTNSYATRRVQGGVFPVSNDGVPPDGIEQAGWPMPFDDVQTTSGTLTTDAGGNLPSAVTGNITSTLVGPFIRMSDNCGAISLTASSGDIDFGTSGGTDCVTPGFGGAGNTHSSRTGFYELNRIKEMGRGQVPGNAWMSQQLTANMNINSTCNAFWNGTVNFFLSGGGCSNTGELAGVFDHELGHGIDANDNTPGISNPGEGISDLYTALRLNDSCIGRNFRPGIPCGGYGDPCISCTGVRDIDFANRQSGQPHDFTWANANCGGGVHCRGYVYSEAVWDLWKRDLPAAPFNMDSHQAHEVVTRLTYIGAGGVSTWFSGSPPFGGCSSSGGYLQYLAADDDNGTTADGTPHMTAIFAAFDRHEIACGSPTVQSSSCAGTPTTAPVVSATPLDSAADLSWGAVAGATKYQVFRTDGVFACDFGKIKAGETTGTSFNDTGLQNGHDYSYVVIAIGPADTCMGPASSCATVTPSAGPPAVCGNGVREGTEECDGADLGGATCGDFGCSGGTLSCTAGCTLDSSACTGCTTCGNGTCELGEDCTSCSADCISQDPVLPGCGNGFCEPGLGEDCLSCPGDCRGKQNGKPSNRFCCGDGDGENPVGCGDSRCNSGGFACSDVLPDGYCCGDLFCEGDEDSFNCEVDCGACVPDEPGTELTCNDSADNDCDADTDCDDADCAGDPACACPLGGPGAACSSNADCCSGKCKGNGICK